ncbi:Vitamin B12 transporter BtuB [Sinobacterium norvegicum]|uniref:Vitamin B12 transporter BtuB n=1 Tax=Sinobacterium norvegicum TaxID=1641715 RepID=A0ABM9AE05_9GAMM|nr:TonB-dependent receptor [Sinobacterium norvegicum]CAH0991439.1 Vitamin B12 transporter BtuB [Sinobacterium norvegicum]
MALPSNWSVQKRIFAIAALPAAIASVLPGQVHAQSPENLVIEEIVVTARKRVENIQEVPVAVTAFSAEKLNEGGITNIANFGDRVPNVELESGNGSTGDANVYIRGVGQRETKSNLDSGVGIYIDGVYIPRASGALLDLNDVESVQVLRGPQGTLFGKNTTGGALVISTQKPDDQLGGKAMVRAGNYNRLDFQGTVNAPLLEDKLLSRLTYASTNRDGTTHNVYDGQDYNDESREAVQLQFRWLNSSTVTTDFNFNYTKTTQKSRGGPCIYSGEGNPPSQIEQSLLLVNNGLTTPGTSPDGQTMNLKAACKSQSGDSLDQWQFASDASGDYNTASYGASATVDWEISDTLSFRSITAYRHLEEKSRDQELDFTSLPVLSRHNTAPTTNNYISQEFQFIGSLFDDKVEYVAGAFLFSEKGKENYNSKTGASFGSNYIELDAQGGFAGNPAATGIPGSTPNATAMLLLDAETRVETEHLGGALFSQADWSISEQWTLTAGLRYTYEKRKLSQVKSSPNIDDLAVLPFSVVDTSDYNSSPLTNTIYVDQSGRGFVTEGYGFGTDPIYAEDQVTNDAWTPMASIQYAFNDSLTDMFGLDAANTYLTLSKGFRAGGLNDGLNNDLQSFDPETVINTEWGLKVDALDRRLRANIAVFSMSYEDIQMTSIRTGGSGRPAPVTVNAAEATMQGVELEITAIPFDNFEVGYSGALLSGEYDDFMDVDGQGNVIDRSDEDMVRAPEYNHFLSMQYFLHTSIGTIVPRAEVQFKGETDYHLTAEGAASGDWVSDTATVYNARLTWTSTNEEWEASLFGRNLGNEYYITGGTDVTNLLNLGNLTYGDPRTYGGEVHFSF